MKLWNDDQQAQAALARAQIEHGPERVDEACIAAANAEREAQRQTSCASRGFRLTSREEAARTEAERAVPPATPRRPMSPRPRPSSTPPGSSRAASCCSRRSMARWPRSSASRRILDAFAARRADAAGDRPDRRLLPVRQGADGRDRRAQDPAWPAGAHHPRRPSPGKMLRRHGAARRALSPRSRSRRARSTLDVDFDHPTGAPGLLVGYSADVEIILAARDEVSARYQPRRSRRAGGAGGRRRHAGGAARQAPGWRTGSTPRCSRGCRPASGSSPRSSARGVQGRCARQR